MTEPKSKSRRSSPFFVVALTLLLAAGATARAPADQETQEPNFLEIRVPEFKLQNETLLDGLWKLTRIPAPFWIGYEDTLRRKGEGMLPAPPGRDLSLSLVNKTYREIFDALCRADSKFTWSADGDTVNVYPRAVVGDPAYLLNRRLAQFELQKATRVEEGLLAVARQLPPPFEQVAVVQFSGDDTYPPQPWTISFQQVTVRQVVNRLAAHGGGCGVWTFGGAIDFRRFAFFRNPQCDEKPVPAAFRGPRDQTTPAPQR